MILSLVAFLLFAFGALAGWRAMLFPVYVLSPVLLATFVFLPWLTVVVLILSVQAGYWPARSRIQHGNDGLDHLRANHHLNSLMPPPARLERLFQPL